MGKYLGKEGLQTIYDLIVDAPVVEKLDYILGTESDKLVRISYDDLMS